jgi:hypothetical protein
MNEKWAWEVVGYSTLLGVLADALLFVICVYIAERQMRSNENEKQSKCYCPAGKCLCIWFSDTPLGKICKLLEFFVCNFEVCPIPSKQKRPDEKSKV